MTSSTVPLTGSIVALVTPMHEDGSVDYPTLRKLIDWHIAEGTDCIGVVGTTGESPPVNVEEHCEIIRVAVEQSAKRVPIMAGCGANSTAEAIELARFAKKVGADCQLQVVAYENGFLDTPARFVQRIAAVRVPPSGVSPARHPLRTHS